MATTDIVQALVARWTDPASRPLFRGKLIDDDVPPGEPPCYCAQGDVLHAFGGWSDQQLRDADQFDADTEVMRLLGICRFHAILLRNVNDRQDGCPQDVLTNIDHVIGPEAPVMLAFARHLDRMDGASWAAALAAAWDAARAASCDAAWDAARGASCDAARDAARAAAWAASWDAAWDAARGASCDAARAAAWAMAEIQGARVMRERGQPFHFLPLFGFADPEAVLAAEAA